MRKQGQIVPKGDGKWLLRVPLPPTPTNPRPYVSKVYEGTIRHAQVELSRMVTEQANGNLVVPQKQTVSVFLTEWIQGKKVAGKTKEHYRWLIEKHVLPALGLTKLQQLSHFQVQRLLDTVSTTAGVQSAHHVRRVLRAALNDAVRMGFLLRNPSLHCELPKVTKVPPKVLDTAAVKTLLASSASSPWYALWCVLLLGGLRPQEACALEWSDVDGDTLVITKAVEWLASSTSIKGTKTERFRRVPLPEQALAALRQHRLRRATSGLCISPLVFPGNTGSLQDLSVIRRAWKRALKTAGLPAMKLYSARHSHASALLALSVHPKVVQERLGHSTITLTLDTYSHVIPSMQQSAVESLSRAMGS